MELTGFVLLLLLLLVHFIADFSLQPLGWISEMYEKNYRSKYLYLHAGIHGLLSLALLSLYVGLSSRVLCFAIAISVSHLIIDLIKSNFTRGDVRWFIIDQFLHVLIIIGIWLALTNQSHLMQQTGSLLLEPKVLLGLLAYFLVIGPFGVLIGLICHKWASEITDHGSLENAGKRIGQLERFLILTFILVGQFAAIGFLLAAKSVLRFGDANEKDHRKINEYILVGTMTSFSFTIAFGLIVNLILDAL